MMRCMRNRRLSQLLWQLSDGDRTVLVALQSWFILVGPTEVPLRISKMIWRKLSVVVIVQLAVRKRKIYSISCEHASCYFL